MPRLLRFGRVQLPLCLAAALLAACSGNEAPDDELRHIKPPEAARIMPAGEALAGAHVPTLDPATLHEAEIRKALASGPRCDFRYTSTGKPVLAIRLTAGESVSEGVVKLNGHLIVLRPSSELRAGEATEGFLLLADPVRIRVSPDQKKQGVTQTGVERREANVTFELGEDLWAGYRGYLDCAPEPQTLEQQESAAR